MNLTLKNIKNILVVIMDTKLYVLLIDLVSLNKNIEVKMQFTNLLVKCLNKLSIVKKLRKKHFQKELAMNKENERHFR